MGRTVISEIAVIGHRNFKETLEELFGLLTFNAGISIFFIVGPAGVGKSRFLEELELALAGPRKGANVVELFRPFLYTECVTQDDGYFLWSDWYIRTLTGLDEPCIDKKRRPTAEEEEYLSTHVWPKSHTKRDAALRLAVENALRRRRVEWLAMDEAHVLTYVRKARLFLGQLESLKSLANTSRVILILAGTYGLLDLLALNSQLRRRTHVVHLAPYYGDSKEDMEEFVKTLRSLVTKLRVTLGMKFEKFAEFMLENTQGCIGAAHDIINRAAALERVKKTDEITMKILSKCKLGEEDWQTLVDDIRTGRDRMKKTRRVTSGHGDNSGGLPKVGSEGGGTDTAGEIRRSGKVGRRKPVHDPVLPGNRTRKTSTG